MCLLGRLATRGDGRRLQRTRLDLDLLFDPRELVELGDLDVDRVPVVEVLLVAADQLSFAKTHGLYCSGALDSGNFSVNDGPNVNS